MRIVALLWKLIMSTKEKPSDERQILFPPWLEVECWDIEDNLSSFEMQVLVLLSREVITLRNQVNVLFSQQGKHVPN